MAMVRMNVPTSPDEARRMASGFWTQDYRIDKNETVWRCDLRKLDEAVRHIMCDPREAMEFAGDPKRYLDRRFGEGTGYCYSHSRKNPHNDYMNYLTPRWMDIEKQKYYRGYDPAKYISDDRADAMALSAWNSSTSTNISTSTTSGTSDNYYWYQNSIKDEIHEQMRKATHQAIKKAPSSLRFKRKRVKTFPFKASKYTSLLDQLQQEFDHWAGSQMKVIHG